MIEVTSPVDGALLGKVQTADHSMVENSIHAASAAFASWSNVAVKERVQVLFRFKQLVENNLKELAGLVSAENGKTLAEAEAELLKGVEVVEFASSMPQLITGELLEVSAGVNCHTRKFPLGVVAGITPFNFPAMVPMWMFPIALACGNAFILKPSDQVPLTPVRLAELLLDAGLPEGLFQVLQGDRTLVETLLDHPKIQAAAFVGSTPVARQVYARGIAAGKRMLALGGAKNHLVVMPDADLEVTARNVVNSSMGCAGQRCMAASVMLAVGESEEIIRAIVAEAGAIRLGKDMGAVINRSARDRIIGYINRAEQRGIKILLDGRQVIVPGKPGGYYVGPTILDGVTPGDECACDEIFGPVLSIVRVPSLAAALAVENASPYGNAASIYTRDGGTAAHFERQANAGMIGINIGVPVPREPFSFGGWNNSRFGCGDITGHDGISFWTRQKKVTTKWTSAAGRNWMS